MEQCEFMFSDEYKIKKPIRLIELFGGIGSQAMALRDIGANFEHYKLVEFDKYAVKSYNAIHDTNFPILDITEVHGDDLEITDTDKYEYIMTYSFPCQDLSIAGLQRGMTKGSGTRSGLLWEVERLLKETKNLPQILLMENVTQVHGEENYNDFMDWVCFLSKLGYSSYCNDLNARNYGVAQNRDRCFMVSILGDYSYKFPEKIKLNKVMKDYLEDTVDEKFYLSDKMLSYALDLVHNQKGTKWEGRCDNGLINPSVAYTVTCGEGSKRAGISNFVSDKIIDNCRVINIKQATKQGYTPVNVGGVVDMSYPDSKTRRGRVIDKGEIPPTIMASNSDICRIEEKLSSQAYKTLLEKNAKEGDVIDAFNEKVNKSGISPTITTRPEGFKTAILPVVKIEDVVIGGMQKNQSVKKDGVCTTLTSSMGTGGGYTPMVFRKNLDNLRIRKLTPRECWRLMGFTDTDYDKAAAVNSNTQLYKQAGNSIVKDVLMAIFRQLF